MHSSRMAPDSTSAAAACSGLASSKSTSGCRLPSPAWNTFATLMPACTDSSLIRSSTSGSAVRGTTPSWTDRKSTRLNSSHLGISYAVFCLKKKDMIDHELLLDYIYHYIELCVEFWT